MKMTLDAELIQKTLNYLSARPWNEVNELIVAIAAQAKPFVDEAAKAGSNVEIKADDEQQKQESAE